MKTLVRAGLPDEISDHPNSGGSVSTEDEETRSPKIVSVADGCQIGEVGGDVCGGAAADVS